MSPRQKRRWLDGAITFATTFVVFSVAPWWLAIIVALYGLWNYYDGNTRNGLTP